MNIHVGDQNDVFIQGDDASTMENLEKLPGLSERCVDEIVIETEIELGNEDDMTTQCNQESQSCYFLALP